MATYLEQLQVGQIKPKQGDRISQYASSLQEWVHEPVHSNSIIKMYVASALAFLLVKLAVAHSDKFLLHWIS